MELKTYIALLKRRLWIILLIFGVVVIAVGYEYYSAEKSATQSSASYSSTVTVRIGLQASNTTNANFSDYETVSEDMADLFVTGPTLTSTSFAQQVTQQIQKDNKAITEHFGTGADLGTYTDPKAILSSITKTRSHTEVTITITWDTEAGSWAIAHAIGEVTQKNASQYLDYEVRTATATDLVDHPEAAAAVIADATMPIVSQGAGSGVGNKKLLAAMLIVGLIIGIALAFLIEYLDDRIRTIDDAVLTLQLPSYGEIPHAPLPGRTKARN